MLNILYKISTRDIYIHADKNYIWVVIIGNLKVAYYL